MASNEELAKTGQRHRYEFITGVLETLDIGKQTLPHQHAAGRL